MADPDAELGELGKVALASIDARRRRLATARTVVLDLLRDPKNQQGGVDLRRVAFSEHGIRSQDTSAALSALEREAIISRNPDFSFRPTGNG